MVDGEQEMSATKVLESKDMGDRVERIDSVSALIFFLELFQRYLHYYYPQFWREGLCYFIFRDQYFFGCFSGQEKVHKR